MILFIIIWMFIAVMLFVSLSVKQNRHPTELFMLNIIMLPIWVIVYGIVWIQFMYSKIVRKLK